ncbi:DUF4124 domain-containing protein [Lysobacter alkalisoli]|uniref:DUF4124 domain-containing protein n=1 Tax=Marilutibacter alkalisoli TaxID=2591633 RepID=A0A514BWX2_9GAMM|nr:DUF4124 domain-containing protein [Lysobacter alkalisoli]
MWTLAALVLAGASAGSAQAGEVIIYRCTDTQGRLTLRDTPCAAGEKQQVQTMQKPTDPPSVATPPAAVTAAPPPPDPPPVQTVVLQPPRPMYECVTPDGDSYISDTPEGNPRWVPMWTLGYPVAVPGHRGGHDGFRADIGINTGRVDGRISIDQRHPRPPLATVAYPTGTWVRDACHPLPQQEVCSRLRDRRFELGRRYNSALQSERAEIDREQRGIDARLANDCRGH